MCNRDGASSQEKYMLLYLMDVIMMETLWLIALAFISLALG